MRDLHDLLHDASPAISTDTDVNGIKRAARRRSQVARSLRAGTATALVLVAAIGVVQVPRLFESRVAFAPSAVELRVPQSGRASAQYLPDGTPVWVVAQDAGEVAVFEALSPHRIYNLNQAVGWCPRSRIFIDYFGASRWDEQGRYVNGPAPASLTQYEVLREGDGRATIGKRMPAPQRQHVGQGPLGGTCSDTDGSPHGNAGPSEWGRYHVPNDAKGVAITDARRATGRVVLNGHGVFGGPHAEATFCPDEIAFEPDTGCKGPSLTFADAELPEGSAEAPRLLSMRILAKVEGMTLTDVVVLAGTDPIPQD